MPLADTRKCQGKKRNGDACPNPAKIGRDFCRFHGGNIPVGIASPQYKTGAYVGKRQHQRALAQIPPQDRHRYRHHLPDYLQQTIETASTDPDIHSLHQEIALTDGLLTDLLRRRFAYGDPGKGWLELTQHWRALESHQQTGNVKGVAKEFSDIGPLLERMAQATALDAEIREQTRLLADLRIREHKRLVDLQSHIPPDAFKMVLRRQQLELRRILYEYCDTDMAERILLQIREAYMRIDLRGLVGATATTPAIDVTPQALEDSAITYIPAESSDTALMPTVTD